jgi:hypothetical protein
MSLRLSPLVALVAIGGCASAPDLDPGFCETCHRCCRQRQQLKLQMRKLLCSDCLCLCGLNRREGKCAQLYLKSCVTPCMLICRSSLKNGREHTRICNRGTPRFIGALCTLLTTQQGLRKRCSQCGATHEKETVPMRTPQEDHAVQDDACRALFETCLKHVQAKI